MVESPLKFKVPWERYGLISAVVKGLHQRSPQLGKTVLQKIVYLLQALADSPGWIPVPVLYVRSVFSRAVAGP